MREIRGDSSGPLLRRPPSTLPSPPSTLRADRGWRRRCLCELGVDSSPPRTSGRPGFTSGNLDREEGWFGKGACVRVVPACSACVCVLCLPVTCVRGCIPPTDRDGRG